MKDARIRFQMRSGKVFVVALLTVVLASCGGPNGISIGVFGGSSGRTGVGMGVGFPIGGRQSDSEVTQTPAMGANMPFAVGEVVAENDLYYRRFLGVTAQGKFVVQDFYKQYENQAPSNGTRADSKLSDAYVLMSLEEVQGTLCRENMQMGNELSIEMLEWLGNLDADGPLVLWFANGQKALETGYDAGHLNGHWTQWFVSGNKQYSGSFVQGERVGRWIRWNDQGVIMEENDYSAASRSVTSP